MIDDDDEAYVEWLEREAQTLAPEYREVFDELVRRSEK